jgi:hypothetical protein
MIPEHLRLLFRAFHDLQAGDTDATIALWRDDGLAETLRVEYFFRTPEQFSSLERKALELCRGRVLDAAAFAGAHALALQSSGKKVCGLSWGEEGVDVLEARGVIDCRGCAIDGVGESFDTVLRLNPGIGLAASIDELDAFLTASRRLIAQGGQLLMHSRDVVQAGSPLQFVYAMRNRMDGRFPGEIRLQIEYQGERGPWFHWLHFDATTLTERAGKTGWRAELVAEDQHGNFLARLS